MRAVHDYAACRLLTLTPSRQLLVEARCLSLLLPFDRVAPISGPINWRRVGLRTVAAQFGRSLGEAAGGGVGDLLGVDLQLAPWQWTAATALRRGDTTRVLLADAVGLGKTIQAGCAVAALRVLGEGRRLLILTPAGLRDQWQAELQRLFHLQPTNVDAAWLRRARRDVPAGVNPWTTAPAAIASIDFIKQPEVLAAAADTPWDVLIVDEAHMLASGSDRRAAAATLAESARHVMLLTATPHTGSTDGFAALGALGRVPGDDRPALLIRRTRADVGLAGSRRVRVARIALSGAERAMHDRLREYAGEVWRERGTHSHAARLAMAVLLKRAASSAWALQRSVMHRLLTLAGREEPPTQPLLPFDDEGETDGADADLPEALGAPGLDERGRELHLLGRVSDAAMRAAEFESKLVRVATLLRRTREPALIFTEYRDTLQRAARTLSACGPMAVLHGGLSRAERQAAERAFTSGEARVLLATDVASEGLNLHGRCRLAINLELPWNPNRLEQRIGRVDRIGQHRRVHAEILVGCNTAESYVLERLAARARNIRRALGNRDAGAALADTLLAAGALEESAGYEADLRAGADPAEDPVGAGVVFAEASTGGADETGLCEWLEHARRLGRGSPRVGLPAGRRERLPVCVLTRRCGRRMGLAPGVVLAFRVEAMTAGGHAAAAAIVAIHGAVDGSVVSSASLKALVGAVLVRAAAAARSEAATVLAHDLERHRDYVARAISRETALLARAGPAASAPAPGVQPGLFDRRALHDAARRHASLGRRREWHTARLAQLALEGEVDPVPRAEPIGALVLR